MGMKEMRTRTSILRLLIYCPNVSSCTLNKSKTIARIERCWEKPRLPSHPIYLFQSLLKLTLVHFDAPETVLLITSKVRQTRVTHKNVTDDSYFSKIMM